MEAQQDGTTLLPKPKAKSKGMAKAKSEPKAAVRPPVEPAAVTPKASTRKLRAVISPKIVAEPAKSTPIKSPECKKSKTEEAQRTHETTEQLLSAPTLVLGDTDPESPQKSSQNGGEIDVPMLPASAEAEAKVADDATGNTGILAEEIPDSQPPIDAAMPSPIRTTIDLDETRLQSWLTTGLILKYLKHAAYISWNQNIY